MPFNFGCLKMICYINVYLKLFLRWIREKSYLVIYI